jgi:hypothetical protein
VSNLVFSVPAICLKCDRVPKMRMLCVLRNMELLHGESTSNLDFNILEICDLQQLEGRAQMIFQQDYSTPQFGNILRQSQIAKFPNYVMN